MEKDLKKDLKKTKERIETGFLKRLEKEIKEKES